MASPELTAATGSYDCHPHSIFAASRDSTTASDPNLLQSSFSWILVGSDIKMATPYAKWTIIFNICSVVGAINTVLEKRELYSQVYLWSVNYIPWHPAASRRIHIVDSLATSAKAAKMTTTFPIPAAECSRKPNFMGKIVVAAALTVMCIIVLKRSPSFSGTSVTMDSSGNCHVW